MFRVNIYLNDPKGVHLIDELWYSDKDTAFYVANTRKKHNPNYLAVVTTYSAVESVTV